MKTISTLLVMLIAAFTSFAQAQENNKASNMLVIYYSHSGNTRIMANQIKKLTGADIFEAVPQKAYPTDYNACVDQAKKEIDADFRPALQSDIDITNYDIIFVGSPNWWATIAPPISTILGSKDFSGKTIVPFMTHGGSRMGHAETDIRKLCPKAKMLTALPIRGKSVDSAKPEVASWLRGLKLIK